MTLTIRTSLVSLCLLLTVGCATLPPGKRDPRDPWERMNRATYSFNDTFDRAIARPVARGYRKAVPHFVQTGVRNFFDNLDTPVVMVNDLLQGQFALIRLGHRTAAAQHDDRRRRTARSGHRSRAGKERPRLRSDARQVGCEQWPVPGAAVPRALRRARYRRQGGRHLQHPAHLHPQHLLASYGLWLVDKVDARSRLLGADQLLDSAYDPYAFLRNAYLQHRDFKVQRRSVSERRGPGAEDARGSRRRTSRRRHRAPRPPQTPPH